MGKVQEEIIMSLLEPTTFMNNMLNIFLTNPLYM